MDLGGIGLGLEALAQLPVRQQLGNFGQDLKVALRGGFGHQQEDEQVDGFVVRRIKRDGVVQPQDGCQRVFETLEMATP